MPFVLLFIKKRKGTADFVKRQSSEYCHPKHAFMITLFYENDKLFNQDTYDNYPVACEAGERNDCSLVERTLNKAVEKYRNARPLFHSDNAEEKTIPMFIRFTCIFQ